MFYTHARTGKAAMTKPPLRTMTTLAVALAISLAAWGTSFYLIHNATNAELEGDLYISFFVGALSLLITGPLAFIALQLLSEQIPLRTWHFAAFYAAISFPALSFQIISFASSIIPGFMPGGWTERTIHTERIDASIACGLLYTTYFFILKAVSKYGLKWTIITSVALVICSIAALALRLINI